MNTPTVRSLEKWQLKSGDDFLQLVVPSGTIISWIDSDGLPQGNLATGGGTPALPLGSVQFNNAGAFGGSDTFTFNPANFGTAAALVVNPAGIPPANYPAPNVLIGLNQDNATFDPAIQEEFWNTDVMIGTFATGGNYQSLGVLIQTDEDATGISAVAASTGGGIIIGVSGWAWSVGSGFADTELQGTQGLIGINTTATVPQGSALVASEPYIVAGTVTLANGLHVYPQSGSGITNSNAILIDDQTQSGAFPNAVAINVQGGSCNFGNEASLNAFLQGYTGGYDLFAVTPVGSTETAIGIEIDFSNSSQSFYNPVYIAILSSLSGAGTGLEIDAYIVSGATSGTYIGFDSGIYTQDGTPTGISSVAAFSADIEPIASSSFSLSQGFTDKKIIADSVAGTAVGLDLGAGTIEGFNAYGIRIGDMTGGTNNWAIKTGAGLVELGDALKVDGHIGFFASAPAAKQTVAGAKLPSDTVMASLLSALAAYGIIVDSTT